MTTGMQLIDAIRRGEATPPSGISTLGLDQTHHWITSVTPGTVTLEWTVDDAHLNLEGAVICVWVAALADQAMFFASNTLCADGEATRTVDFHLRSIGNITAGVVSIHARILDRTDDTMHAACDFRTDDGRLAATVSAVINVVR